MNEPPNEPREQRVEPTEPTALDPVPTADQMPAPTMLQTRPPGVPYDQERYRRLRERASEKKTPKATTLRGNARDRLTVPEATLLEAWRAFKEVNRWLHPTHAELAHLMSVSPQRVSQLITSLAKKGVVYRYDLTDRGRGRGYALTPECAARPHLVTLMRLCMDITKLKPEEARTEAGAERYAALWMRARTLCQEVALLAVRVGNAARDAAQPPPSE